MAYRIDSKCTACGECLPKCPNDAITPGAASYRVEPLLCTECVGYAEEPQCVEICPEDVIHLAAELLAPFGGRWTNTRRRTFVPLKLYWQ